MNAVTLFYDDASWSNFICPEWHSGSICSETVRLGPKLQWVVLVRIGMQKVGMQMQIKMIHGKGKGKQMK